MNDMIETQLPPSALALADRLALMSRDALGEVRESFTCTELLNKRENAALTLLKRYKLLSTCLQNDEEQGGVALVVQLTSAGCSLMRRRLGGSCRSR